MATNNFQSDSESVQATYMSQTEANEVMEIWARRQREDAERQAMVTVHDVAEATQLAPQEVQRLLQELRASKPIIQATSQPTFARPKQNSEITYWDAFLKLAPASAVLTLFIFMIAIKSEPMSFIAIIAIPSFFWTLGIAIFFVVRSILKSMVDAKLRQAGHKPPSNTSGF